MKTILVSGGNGEFVKELNKCNTSYKIVSPPKEEMNVKLAYETNMKNAGLIQENYQKIRKEILQRAKKRIKKSKLKKKKSRHNI